MIDDKVWEGVACDAYVGPLEHVPVIEHRIRLIWALICEEQCQVCGLEQMEVLTNRRVRNDMNHAPAIDVLNQVVRVSVLMWRPCAVDHVVAGQKNARRDEESGPQRERDRTSSL